MKPSDLVNHFSTVELSPIDLCDDIIPVIKAEGDFEIYFWHVEMDTNILKGRVIVDNYPREDEEIRCVSIDYARSLSNEMARLVCVKELIHVLDPIDERVISDSAVNELIEKIILPPEMQSLDDGQTVWSDRFGFVYALAVLFPWAARELLRPKYESGDITIDEIAGLVELPVEYALAVMSPEWSRLHHLITR